MDKKRKGIKVLIVDDEEIIREVLSYAIKGRGFISEDAKNGKEALKKVAQGRPDIIILDVAMPEMDGLEACKQLRENPYTLNIPIIFLSAQRNLDKFIQGMPGAAIKYIAKPCDIEDLLKQIDNCTPGKNLLR